MQRWRAHAATNKIAMGELAAGFGRTLLTPTVGSSEDDPEHGKFRVMPLAGYGDRKGRSASGVHDDLYIKAVALRVGNRTTVMIGADLLIMPREIADLATARLDREVGLSREQIYFSATHTHASLGAWGEGSLAESFAGGFQPGARTWISECIILAVKQALADLKPAAFGYGRFQAPELVRNRLVGQLGEVDPEFSFALFKQEGGGLAVLGSFSAHGTVLSSRVMEFSGDYPGAWQKAVEQSTGGIALFLAGGVGSHSPVAPRAGFDGANEMGQALARRVVDCLS